MKNQVLEKNVVSALKINREEAELIRKALHLEEVSICEVLADDKEKYRGQLDSIRKLYDKLERLF